MRVYVAGPYTSPEPAKNVSNAMDVAHVLMDLGYSPLVPHLSHYLHIHRWRPYEDWMRIDFDWVKVAEVIFRMPGESSGADREVMLANELGIPVVRSIEELNAYRDARAVTL